MRKKLLSEAQVRRFQSLASIKPLNEMDSSYARDDEDEAAMKDDYMEGEEDMDEALHEEEDEDMDLDKDEDEDMGEADVELDEELVDQFMDAVKTIEQVADALGGAGGSEDMDMGGDDLDMDMGGDDAPMELDAGDEKEPEEDEEEMLQEALRGISYVPSEKEIVKLVAKRVAKRLQEAKRAEAELNRALGKRR